MEEEVLLCNSHSNFNTQPLDSELDLTTNLVQTMDDSDIFKFFLSDDLSTLPDVNGEYLAPGSSPSSSVSLEPSSSDSPQPSPPQLSPEVALDIPSVPSQMNTGSHTSAGFSGVHIKEEDTNVKGKGSRKRERSSTKESEAQQALSREEMMKLSTKSLDTFTQNLNNGKQFTQEEEKLLKRQKRLIKNRESAQLSRLRKKIYIEELEKKVTNLTSETEALSKQVLQLNGEKRKLQEEVMYLQSIIKQSPELSELATRKVPVKNVKAAGICLLIVMFSIGLLFNANQNDPSLSFLSRNREQIPEVVPKSGKNVYTGRVLKSMPSEDVTDIEVVPVTSEIRGSTKTSFVKSVAEESLQIPVQKDEKKHPRDHEDKSDRPLEVAKKRKVRISDEQDQDEAVKTSLVPADQVRGAVKQQNAEIVPRRDPNASYIYCPEAHHVAPATSTSGPEIVALLIPASLFNGTTIFGNHPGLDSSLLEVSCSVLNLHMWPLQNATAQP